MPRLLTSAALVAGALLAGASLAGCTVGSDGGTSPPPSVNSPEPSSSSTGGGPSTDEGSSAVTQGEAGTIAVDEYGGTVISVENDHYRGEAAWEVELRDSEQGRIEVKVEKSSGDILAMEHDRDDD